MRSTNRDVSLELVSLLKDSGELELSLVEAAVPEPGPDEVLIRVEAAPINPSDLGLLLAAADPATARGSGPAGRPVLTAQVPAGAMRAFAARVGQPVRVGNEGAGVVVAGGSSPDAQALLGRTVAAMAGGMYAQFRCVKTAHCLPLPPGTTPAQGASCFVNPLTALGMIETMRHEGHRALVHTAAASNLGQMLNRLCIEEGVGLVNVVRSEEQRQLLAGHGARHVCDSNSPGFVGELTEAIATTGATLAFDAVGGGGLAGRILACMEAALARNAGGYQRYGTAVHKQVYIYGALDVGPTVLKRNFGAAWGVGGWLLPMFLDRIGRAATEKLKARVVQGLGSTFASHYTKVVSLADALTIEELVAYARRRTGEKYLIDPSRTAGGDASR